MAWSTSVVAPPDGAMRDYRASLERLLGRTETVYFPGHGSPVRDPKRWLIGAVCHASRGYWRMVGKTDPLPPNIDDFADPRPSDTEEAIVDRVTIAAAINQLGTKCREVLRLFYAEGYSANEIAEILDTTPGYVMQLLHNCRKRVRSVYHSLRENRS